MTELEANKEIEISNILIEFLNSEDEIFLMCSYANYN